MSKFYQSALDFNDTENVVNRFEEILAIPLDSVVQLEVFLQKESELLGQIEEMLTGHYIDFNCYSNSTETKKSI